MVRHAKSRWIVVNVIRVPNIGIPERRIIVVENPSMRWVIGVFRIFRAIVVLTRSIPFGGKSSFLLVEDHEQSIGSVCLRATV